MAGDAEKVKESVKYYENQVSRERSLITERIGSWTKLETAYVQLQGTLDTLADKPRHRIMVPMGPKAFMRGELIHTNELMILLGENIFAERSSKQASAIVDRRLDSVQASIHGLLKEQQRMDQRMGFTNLLAQDAHRGVIEQEDGFFEIREDYVSEDEDEHDRIKDASTKSKVPITTRTTTTTTPVSISTAPHRTAPEPSPTKTQTSSKSTKTTRTTPTPLTTTTTTPTTTPTATSIPPTITTTTPTATTTPTTTTAPIPTPTTFKAPEKWRSLDDDFFCDEHEAQDEDTSNDNDNNVDNEHKDNHENTDSEQHRTKKRDPYFDWLDQLAEEEEREGSNSGDDDASDDDDEDEANNSDYNNSDDAVEAFLDNTTIRFKHTPSMTEHASATKTTTRTTPTHVIPKHSPLLPTSSTTIATTTTAAPKPSPLSSSTTASSTTTLHHTGNQTTAAISTPADLYARFSKSKSKSLSTPPQQQALPKLKAQVAVPSLERSGTFGDIIERKTASSHVGTRDAQVTQSLQNMEIHSDLANRYANANAHHAPKTQASDDNGMVKQEDDDAPVMSLFMQRRLGK